MTSSSDVTALLQALEGGHRESADLLFKAVYNELKRTARRQLANERSNHTLQTTALVHEAYLKLVDQTRVDWKNEAQFMGVASMAMRRILINYAKSRAAQKRGGNQPHISLQGDEYSVETPFDELLELDEALKSLEAIRSRQAQVVMLRFFGGLDYRSIAKVLDVSVPTARLDWRMAKAWLSREMGASPN